MSKFEISWASLIRESIVPDSLMLSCSLIVHYYFSAKSLKVIHTLDLGMRLSKLQVFPISADAPDPCCLVK